ncbi:unnamed protein product [Victoria cruziana]
MAGNKFATVLSRNMPRITVILVYAVLEWILIILLLLNSLFSYVIGKYASFFGLKPPCPLCCRVDHVLEPEKKEGSSYYADTVCEAHAKEISRLGYCLNHARLVEACQTCEDCSLERGCTQGSLIACVSLVEQVDDGDDKELKCSCCGVRLDDGFYSNYFFKDGLFKPAWDVSEYTNKGTLVGNEEEEEEEEEEENEEDGDDQGEEEGQGENEHGEQAEGDDDGQVDAVVVDFGDDGNEQKEGEEDDDDDEGVVVVGKEEVEKAVDESIEEEAKGREAASAMDDSSCDVMRVNLEDPCEDERILPVELIDSVTEENVLKEKAVHILDNGSLPHPLDDLGVCFQSECIHNESPAHSRDYLSVLELDVSLAGSSDRIDVGSQQSHSEAVIVDHDDSGAAAAIFPEGDYDQKVLIRFSPGHDQINAAPEAEEITDSREEVVNDGVIREEPMVQLQGCEEIPLSNKEDYGGDAEKDTVCNVLQDEEDQVVEQREDLFVGNDKCTSRKDVLYTVSLPEEDQESEETEDSLFGDDNGHTKEDVRVVLLDENRVVEETNDSTTDDDTGDAQNDGSSIKITEENQDVKQTVDPAVDDDAWKYTCTVPNNEEVQGLEQAADSVVSVDKGDKEKENDSFAKEDGGLGQTGEPAIEEVDCYPASDTVVVTEKTEERTEGLSTASEFIDLEEEKAPDTPTYIEGIHTLRKRPMIDRKDSGTESFDGSVVSEIEGGEALIIERLKSALKTERNALNALYTELEEERNAAAIAANQTMAMITRLQEEKAAMQMEALQYQRMMEEQSEYDQEALQLMNELMVKREKEKQELEKELELYRKKVLRYEAREKRMRKTKSSENGENVIVDHEVGRSLMSSPSSSTWDSDELSVDFDDGDDDTVAILESNKNTPVDAVMESSNGHENTKELTTLDESLADFEQERDSILVQLKALEEKLFTLSDEESTKVSKPRNGNDGPMVPAESVHVDPEEVYQEGMNDDYGPYHEDTDKGMFGHLSSEETHLLHLTHRKYTGPKPKRLLPLFDAATSENETEEQDEGAGFPHLDIQLSTNTLIQEEVKEVYERLEALEADREFLQHSIKSIKKGGKGIGLLREILQNLRDLRAVELRARNVGDPMP